MTYDSLDDMWLAMLDALVAKRGGPSRCGDMEAEIVGSQWRLASGCDSTFLLNQRRAACPVYASAELLWYLSRNNSGEALLPYAPQYEKFLEEDGRAFGAYGHRLLNNVEGSDLLEEAIGLLQKSPETRQCVVAIWNPRDLIEAVRGGRRDLPCTLGWQFFIRDEELIMSTYMRSNDVWLGVPYDVYCFTCIQRLVAAELGVKVGEYVHTVVGSLHLYSKHAVAAEEARGEVGSWAAHGWDGASKLSDAWLAVEAEKAMRADKLSKLPPGSLLRDAVACVGNKWAPGLYKIHSSALKHAFINKEKRCSS